MLDSGRGWRESRRWILLIYVGWLPPDITSSRSCLCLRTWVGLAEPDRLLGCPRVLLTGRPRPESNTLHFRTDLRSPWRPMVQRPGGDTGAVLHVLSMAPRAPNTGGAVGKRWRTAAHLSAQHTRRMGPAHHLAGNGPGEPHELARRRGGHGAHLLPAPCALSQRHLDALATKVGEIHLLAVVQNRSNYNGLIYSHNLDHTDSVEAHCNHLGNTNGTPASPD